MRYLEESQGVSDFSPLSAPFGRGELSPLPFPLLTQILSKQGWQFPNYPHSYMIDNKKLLSGADYYIF